MNRVNIGKLLLTGLILGTTINRVNIGNYY